MRGARHNRRVGAVLRSILEADRTGLVPRSGLRRTLGVTVVLLVGVALGHPTEAAVAGLGALIVGLADIGGPRPSAVRLMLIAMAAMGAAGFVGAQTADHDVPAIAVTAVWAFGGGLLARYGRPGAVVGLLSTLALIVTQAHYLDPGSAAKHAALLMAGGAVEVVLLLVWRSERHPIPDLPLGFSLLRHALRLGIALAAATATYRLLPFGAHGYWIVATALFILRPGIRSGVESGVARYAGAAMAVVASTALATWLQPGDYVIVGLAAVSAMACFSLYQYNFALFTAGVSALLIFMAALAGLPPRRAALDFLIDTTFGAAIAIGSYVVVPEHRRAR
ncbi:MAG: FUSC family protein [Acidimicrobiales bacterium]